jgi:hypothetical protein
MVTSGIDVDETLLEELLTVDEVVVLGEVLDVTQAGAKP